MKKKGQKLDGRQAEHYRGDMTNEQAIRPSVPQISSDRYQWTHGHKPRGRGLWAFYPDGSTSNEDVWFAPSQTLYREAKLMAKRAFAAKGITLIHVGG